MKTLTDLEQTMNYLESEGRRIAPVAGFEEIREGRWEHLRLGFAIPKETDLGIVEIRGNLLWFLYYNSGNCYLGGYYHDVESLTEKVAIIKPKNRHQLQNEINNRGCFDFTGLQKKAPFEIDFQLKFGCYRNIDFGTKTYDVEINGEIMRDHPDSYQRIRRITKPIRQMSDRYEFADL